MRAVKRNFIMQGFKKKIRPGTNRKHYETDSFYSDDLSGLSFSFPFFTAPTERPNTHWKTFYKNVSPTPREKDISSQARVIDSSSLGEK